MSKDKEKGFGMLDALAFAFLVVALMITFPTQKKSGWGGLLVIIIAVLAVVGITWWWLR